MTKSIVFLFILLITLGFFAYTMRRIFRVMMLMKPFHIDQPMKRLKLMFQVAVLQSKIFRRPAVGLAHALVFWGFLVITLGSIEMVVDGISGSERVFSSLGSLYLAIVLSGDIFSLIVLLGILLFLFRRLFLRIHRFYGDEMKPVSKIDAGVALVMILMLMVSLIGTNVFYLGLHHEFPVSAMPVSRIFLPWLAGMNVGQIYFYHEVFWWSHILLIFAFANYLPYSKHFHVFTSIPNVYLTRLQPLGQMEPMPEVEVEVRQMLFPDAAAGSETPAPGRFGIRDVEDMSWKSYFDSLACTECGRCTSVCPANLTGKKLSPRKIMMDIRARVREKRSGMLRAGKTYQDGRSLLNDWISPEELWACTTCNACAQECPVNINQPLVILGMRRYLVMEEAAVPHQLASMLSNIENNGAPWQYPAEVREEWMKS